MKLTDHCKRSYDTFGNCWADVHEWLDEFAGMTYPLHNHRSVRHHMGGVYEVREKWGVPASEAAYQHILDDIISRGISAVPENREEAEKIFGDMDEFIEGD